MGSRSVNAESAVSSVVGTVLMLSITVAVFGGFSVVALGYLQQQPTPPRADMAVVSTEQSLLFAHQGGEGFSAEDGTVYVNVDGVQTTIELTDAGLAAYGKTLADLDLDDGWDVGDILCLWGQDATCLFDPDDVEVLGAYFVDDNTLLLENGERGGDTPAEAPDLIVSLVSQSPTTAATGSSVTWTVRVTNQGTADTAAVTLVVAVQVDSSTVALASVSGPLAIGASLDATSTPAWTGIAGTHTLTLVADSTDLVSETSESNNEAESAFTVSSSTADPGQPFIDTNGDGLYTPGTDTLIDLAQVTDCNYDAGGEGLVLPPSVGTITASSCDFQADENLIIGVSLVTTSGNLDLTGDDITVASGVTLDSDGSLSIVPSEDFVGDGATFLAEGTLRIGSTSPGQLGVTASLVGATLDNTAGSGELQIQVDSGTIDATNADLRSKGAINIGGANSGHQAGAVILSGASLDNSDGSSAITIHDVAGDITATGIGTQFISKGAITLTATGAIDVSQATLDNADGSSQISLSSSATLGLTGTTLESKGQIDLTASGAIVGTGAVLDNDEGSSQITITGSSTVALASAQLSSKGQIQVTASSTLTLTDAVVDNDDGSSAISLTSSTTVSAANLEARSKGSITITGTSGLTLTNAIVDNDDGSSSVTLQSSGGAISAAGLEVDTKGTLAITAATGLTLTNGNLDNSNGSGTGTLTTTAGTLACDPCTVRINGNLALSGAAVTATGAQLATPSGTASLTVTSTGGALSAASVTAQTTGDQTWKSSSTLTLDGATLSAPGRNLVACLSSSTADGLSLSGTLSFTDSSNKLDAQRGSSCSSNANSDTYVTPWPTSSSSSPRNKLE